MSTLLYQQSNVEMFWNERERWLYVKWIGSQSLAEINRDCEQMLRMLAAKNADSVLNDNSNMEGMWISASDWGTDDWFQRMRSAGLRYLAWVDSHNHSPHAQPSLPATLPMGVARAFGSVEEAANWLRIQRRRDAAKTQRIKLPLNLPKR